MKRLPLVAIGVALCAFATGAEAQSGRMRLGAYGGSDRLVDGDWNSMRPLLKRRSVRGGKGRHVAGKPGRGGRRGRVVEQLPLGGRGLVSFSRSVGASRTCLTPSARDLLARIEAQFGPVDIVSTCRPGAVIAGSGRPSRHASGNAIDFNAPAGKKSDVVRWLIANHRAGGVMTYADMGHIHVDIGRHFVALGANSGRRGRLALRRSD
jgi:hypothetical protein